MDEGGTSVITNLIAASVYMLAAFCAFVEILNRCLIHVKESRFKAPMIGLCFLGAMIGSGILGYGHGFSLWVLFPVMALMAVGASEVQCLVIRRSHRGDPPVEITDGTITLTKPFTTTALKVVRYEVHWPDWKGRPARIAHISDLHVNPWLDQSYYLAAMERVNALEPDLVLITGDYLTHFEYADRLPAILSRVTSRLGTFGILGNHDHWEGAEQVGRIVEDAGVTLLGNSCRRIGIGENRLAICGCEEPWADWKWEAPVVAPGEMMIVLTHTADNIYRISHAGAAAAFAGHYHGGQLKIPFLGSVVVPSVYGRRFDHGHFVVNGTHLFVTAGIGAAKPPLRVYCKPDILVVDLKA
jgi:uncharacterized protein